ncbi:MAG: 3-deoxy-7-phosphoheptulonate synthase, partial [Ignavibacteriae bacterium]|nr:3-deoxy-7-phosphoheptulonate synthase [Ignavibacteriota bacterium]
SKDTESIDGTELPVYRGHLVNGPEPDPESRRPDPVRMLIGFLAAGEREVPCAWMTRWFRDVIFAFRIGF